MTERVERAGLNVATQLAEFIEDHALVGTGVDRDAFWQGFSDLIHDFGPNARHRVCCARGG